MITLNRFLKLCVCGLVLVLTAAAQLETGPSQQVQPAPSAQAEESSLSIQDVIDLVEAGLSDDLVVAAVRKRRSPFDLGTADLLRLKKAGVRDAVIRVMIDPASRADSSKAGSDAVTPSARPGREGSTQGLQVEEIGFYLLESETPIQISAKSFSAQKLGGLSVLKMAATAGIAKAKQKAVLRGQRASVRTSNKRPEFFFYAAEGFSPEDYLLVEFKTKGKHREAIVGTMGITGASGGFQDKNVLPFSSTKTGVRRYRVSFESDLASGEYCFYPAADVQIVGDAVNASGRLYDFGVDWEKR